MKVLTGLLILSATAFAQVHAVNYYTGGPVGDTYLWVWGFEQEPAPMEQTGYTPGGAAIEVLWQKAVEGWDDSWLTYGVYLGDHNFDFAEIIPDSVYFKLRAPEGVGEGDRLNVWLYDPRNSDWNNALLYEIESLDVLQDSAWHQFAIGLDEFWEYVNSPDYSNLIAVSIERPAEDPDSEFPLMYIDHVWVGDPMVPLRLTVFDGKQISGGIATGKWGLGDNALQIAAGEGSTDSTDAIVWEGSNGDGWQGLQFSFPPQNMRYAWATDTLNISIKAPEGINTLSLGFYDKDGYAVWYPVEAAKFGFDGEWKKLSIALNNFSLYWDKFDTSSVTEFRIENGYENQTISERLLFDMIYTSNSGGGLTLVQDHSSDEQPTQFSLQQNYPNPFNPSTTISFELGKAAMTTLSIYNIRGEKVTDLVSENLPAGRHSYNWNAADRPSGTYFYKLMSGNFVQTRKMLLIQ